MAMTARALTYLALLLTCGGVIAPAVAAAPSAAVKSGPGHNPSGGSILEQMAELYDVDAVAYYPLDDLPPLAFATAREILEKHSL